MVETNWGSGYVSYRSESLESSKSCNNVWAHREKSYCKMRLRSVRNLISVIHGVLGASQVILSIFHEKGPQNAMETPCLRLIGGLAT